MAIITTSNQFTLNAKDFLKGLIMAIGGAIYGLILGSIYEGSLTFDWKKISTAALGAAVVYLGKNFLSPAAIIIDAPPSQVQAVKDGDAEVIVTSK